MQKIGERILLSATDLANHLACRHLTELNRKLAFGELEKPYRDDPILEMILERGKLHEKAYVEHLRMDSGTVVEILESDECAFEKTLAAMRSGADVVVQGAFANERWVGRPDFLLKTARASEFGDWSYEVADTKLTRNTRAGTLLQICLYSDLLAEVQGVRPDRMLVVKPGGPFEIDTFRIDDYAAYYRFVKQELEASVDVGATNRSYPETVTHCDICRWWTRCNQQRRDDDHLSFVAGIQKLQIIELCAQGTTTLRQFARLDEPLTSRPERGSIEAYQRVHQQAKIQQRGRESGRPEFEFLDLVEGRGFLKLPLPDPGDVFFDIEGDPHAPDGGLEYLLGYVLSPAGPEAASYHELWAVDRRSEKRGFEQFIDLVMDRWSKHPGMHVYHYAPYEPSAVKRLSTRHAAREEEVDQLLRANRFVDLYAVVRQGIRASVESYSIKKMEPFYGYRRLEELADARHALHRLERAVELGLTEHISDEDRRTVARYNKDDCLSTLALRDWLEGRRDELLHQGKELPRPELLDGSASDEIEQRAAQVAEIFDVLLKGVPYEERDPDQQARWMLAHLLEYFRREDKCVWWEYFRINQLEYEELLFERDAIAGLRFEGELPTGPRARNPTHRYRFEPQEVSIKPGDSLHEVMRGAIGSVADIDDTEGILDIRKRADSVDRHPVAVLAHEYFNPDPMPESLLSFARSVISADRNGTVPRCARYDLLAKQPPRLKSLSIPLPKNARDAATELAFDLDGSVLALQGPPGTGKTHLAAQMIDALAKAGKRIGVTAVSHKVIANLLSRVRENSDHARTVAHRTDDKVDLFSNQCERLRSTKGIVKALFNGKVVGGTAWAWSKPRLEGELDYLFIDEAGQMSLAMALAAGRSAKNIILLGDPQQLEQPQRGAHPEGAEVAALKHYIARQPTIAPDRGLFLDKTWRLHPDICRFTSEEYYEGRLRSRDGLDQQRLSGLGRFSGNGLFFLPVSHTGNQNRADEEVAAIRQVFGLLRDGCHRWVDMNGTETDLSLSDVLVIAPYNAQVAQLKRSLPEGTRVGTVDKFQGQEAPVVIYSLTSSSQEDAPRGMEFLYSPNRLNVATSRARCVCILVGSPRLFEPDCRSPRQMMWANGLARFKELAQKLSI